MTARRGSVASARLSLYSAAWDDWARNNAYLYNGVADQPQEKSPKSPLMASVGQTARDANLKKWDGAARRKVEWDGLRKDPELWCPHGNCYVHLYGRGASKRGPAFKVPMEALVKSHCYPLLNRFLEQELEQSPASEHSSWGSEERLVSRDRQTRYDLYIPAPQTVDRAHAMLYHIATRNFFAWLLGKSMVGSHLGGALVGLLETMQEFRTPGCDNVDDILQYMDEEGYADMDSHPDHALAVLYFAEHFEFENLWIDAYVHCVGMHERLLESTEFEHLERVTRSLIARARAEMNIRLNRSGRSLSTFLEDDLSKVNQKLPESARAELDRFRSFLQAYYVAKLGYYPPTSVTGARNAAFPKHILETLRHEFQSLYDYIVDENSTSMDEPRNPDNGLSILKLVQLFDAQHRYKPLPHPLPLLPEISADITARSSSGRFPWTTKSDKLKLDERLVVVSSLAKATNRQRLELLDCTLVRAYRGFEKQAVFSKMGNQKKRISQAEARKVRWILVYSMLQTIISVTNVPDQVSNKSPRIPYHMSVLIAGCPPWTNENMKKHIKKEKEQRRHSIATDSLSQMIDQKLTASHRFSIMPDAVPEILEQTSGQHGNVRRALSNLGKMPELRHPTPLRSSCHEILASDYTNGISAASATSERPAIQSSVTPSPTTTYSSTFSVPTKSHKHTISDDTASSDNAEDLSHWSRSSQDSTRPSSTSSGPSAHKPTDATTTTTTKHSILDLFDRPLQSFLRKPSNAHADDGWGMSDSSAVPAPLAIPERNAFRKSVMMVTQEVTVRSDEVMPGNEELERYLNS